MRRTLRRARAIGAAIAAAIAAVGAPGCNEGFDPLDPEVLAEVARSRGDAQGFERSGVYVGELDVLECGCDGSSDDSTFDLSLCVTLERFEQFGLPPTLDIELVQADGTVRMKLAQAGGTFDLNGPFIPVLYGPLQADGRVSAAGVLQADVIAVQGQVLGRVDGVVERQDDQWTLVAEYQQRYAIDLISEADVLDIGLEAGEVKSVDCRERIALDLRWISPPYEPLVGEE